MTAETARLWWVMIVFPVLPALAEATPLNEIWVSPDVTLEFMGATANDESVIVEASGGPLGITGVGALPVASNLDAYHLLPNGQALFSLDTTAS